jgi:hypothetical protein
MAVAAKALHLALEAERQFSVGVTFGRSIRGSHYGMKHFSFRIDSFANNFKKAVHLNCVK